MPAWSLLSPAAQILPGEVRLGDQVLGVVADDLPHHVVLERGRPGRGSYLRGRPELVVVGARYPADQVGEAEVGEEVPLAQDVGENRDILSAEIGAVGDDLGQGQHAAHCSEPRLVAPTLAVAE